MCILVKIDDFCNLVSQLVSQGTQHVSVHLQLSVSVASCCRHDGQLLSPRSRSPARAQLPYPTPTSTAASSPSYPARPQSRPASAASDVTSQHGPASNASLAPNVLPRAASGDVLPGPSRVRQRDAELLAADQQPSKRPRASKWDQQKSTDAVPPDLPPQPQVRLGSGLSSLTQKGCLRQCYHAAASCACIKWQWIMQNSGEDVYCSMLSCNEVWLQCIQQVC